MEIKMDMIVTESREYNVLLGNIWLKYVNALIDYEQNCMTIKYKDQQQTIPVTCTQKMDPNQFILIDPQEELELEEEVDNSIIPFYSAEIIDDTFQIDERQYATEFMEYCNLQYQQRDGKTNSQEPEKCLCKILKEHEYCEECD